MIAISTTAPAPPSGYRPALDGLRAAAVFGVILYHLGYRWMKGGFLGVDVFFVLSGYLITSILASSIDRGGIRPWPFWAQRARRLLPAVLLLCVVVAAAVHWLQPMYEWSVRQEDLLGTILYGMNWHLIDSEQDYFAQYSAASPLRHAWSLAIEEQFYVVWPIVLIFLTRLTRGSRKAIVALVAAGAVGSAVVMAVTFDLAPPSRAYYGTDTRAHELLVGAVLGLAMIWYPSLSRDRGKLADAAAVVCALAIAAAFLVVPDSSPVYYRGGSLLLSLTVVVLLWAVETRPLGIAARLLSLAPVRWLGQLSYGLYLWHWPVILFSIGALVALFGSRSSALVTNTTALNLLRIALTVAIASASYYLLEQPIRRGKLARLQLTNWRVFRLAPTAMAVAAIGSLSLTAVPPGSVAPEPGEYQCAVTTALMCVRRAAAESRPVVAVVGDSTARSLDAGIIELSRKYDWTYVAAGQNGCSIIDRAPLTSTTDQPAPGNARCPQDNSLIRQQLLDVYRPKLIVAMERFLMTDYLDESGQRSVSGSPAHVQATEQGLEKAALALTTGGAKLVFIQTLPVGLPLDCSQQPNAERPDCLNRASSDRVTATYDGIIRNVALRHPDTMRVLSIASVVCPEDRCLPEIEGIVIRYDRIHFTKTAARWLAPYLDERLRAVGAVPIVPAANLSSPRP